MNRPTATGSFPIMDSPPDWAIERAKQECTHGGGIFLSFAAYIAANETPPVDPIEAEVTRLLPHAFGHPPEVIIRTALKAGVSLAERERSK